MYKRAQEHPTHDYMCAFVTQVYTALRLMQEKTNQQRRWKVQRKQETWMTWFTKCAKNKVTGTKKGPGYYRKEAKMTRPECYTSLREWLWGKGIRKRTYLTIHITQASLQIHCPGQVGLAKCIIRNTKIFSNGTPLGKNQLHEHVL